MSIFPSPPTFPKEHGAYAQLGISLAAGLSLAPTGSQGWAQALASGLVFLASDPLLVWAGQRTGKGQNAQQSRATARLQSILYGLLLLPALVWAWKGADPSAFLGALPSLGFGALLLALFLKRREHSLPGELAAAFAFSFTALPVALLNSVNPRAAWLLALSLAALHGLGTLLVRGILWSRKAQEARGPRLVPVAAGLALSGALALSGLPKWSLLAPLPLTLASLVVLVRMPHARHFRPIGWALTAGTILGIAVVRLALG
ncbi:MAG: YwiC-like family protein [Firmicutes bacterium]|nr:YwiC-like family protein [Bacillota bacterium]